MLTGSQSSLHGGFPFAYEIGSCCYPVRFDLMAFGSDVIFFSISMYLSWFGYLKHFLVREDVLKRLFFYGSMILSGLIITLLTGTWQPHIIGNLGFPFSWQTTSCFVFHEHYHVIFPFPFAYCEPSFNLTGFTFDVILYTIGTYLCLIGYARRTMGRWPYSNGQDTVWKSIIIASRRDARDNVGLSRLVFAGMVLRLPWRRSSTADRRDTR